MREREKKKKKGKSRKIFRGSGTTEYISQCPLKRTTTKTSEN